MMVSVPINQAESSGDGVSSFQDDEIRRLSIENMELRERLHSAGMTGEGGLVEIGRERDALTIELDLANREIEFLGSLQSHNFNIGEAQSKITDDAIAYLHFLKKQLSVYVDGDIRQSNQRSILLEEVSVMRRRLEAVQAENEQYKTLAEAVELVSGKMDGLKERNEQMSAENDRLLAQLDMAQADVARLEGELENAKQEPESPVQVENSVERSVREGDFCNLEVIKDGDAVLYLGDRADVPLEFLQSMIINEVIPLADGTHEYEVFLAEPHGRIRLNRLSFVRLTPATELIAIRCRQRISQFREMLLNR